MAESSATSRPGPSRKDKGKAKVGIEYEDLRISEEDDQEITSALQENKQSADHHSSVVFPFKKRRADEVEGSTVGTPQEESSTDQQSDTRQEADELKEDEKAPDDQTETDLKPGSRAVTKNEYCLSKTLGRSEVIPHNPQLYLDVEDTSFLLDWPEMFDFVRISFSVALLVFDGNDRRYDMLLNQHVSGGRISYTISRGWGDFVRMHNLKAGDEITFYRFFDSRVSDVYFYVLRYFRKPMDRPPCLRRNKLIRDDTVQKLLQGSSSVEDKGKGLEQIEPKVDINQPESGRIEGDQVPVENTSDQTERKVQGPGSRVLISVEYCMEKTLTTYEVIEDAKLYLNAYDASELTAFPEIVNYPPGTYSKTLLVYDKDIKRYDMLLKHHISNGMIGYAISSGWESFVRTHDLKAGDVVTFFRVLDESVSDDYYHVRYTRKSVNVKGDDETSEKTIDDRQKNPKTRYKVEARRKEDGGLVIKFLSGK